MKVEVVKRVVVEFRSAKLCPCRLRLLGPLRGLSLLPGVVLSLLSFVALDASLVLVVALIFTGFLAGYE